MDALTEAVYAATTKLYQKMQAEQQAQQAGSQQQGEPGPGGAGPSEKPEDDNVVNADYKVKDE